MKKIASWCAGTLLLTAAGVSGFDMVKGSGTAEIVLPEKPENSSRLAAKELSEYVEKMTGRRPDFT